MFNQRTKALEKLASEMQLNFQEKADEKIKSKLSEGKFSLLSGLLPPIPDDIDENVKSLVKPIWGKVINKFSKETIQVENVLKGQYKSIPIYIFDCRRKVKSQDFDELPVSGEAHLRTTSSNSSQTVLLFDFPEDLRLPQSSVLAKQENLLGNIFSQIGSLFGKVNGQDEFYKLYTLLGRQQIQKFFSPENRAFYLEQKNLCTESEGSLFICYRVNTIVEPQDIQAFLSTGLKALELFKTRVQEVANQYTLPLELQDDEILSKECINYNRLRDFLKANKWKEADLETSELMLRITRREIERYLDEKSIKNFPCTDLKTLDQLWMKYSNNRFGFSTQQRIWEELGGKFKEYTWKETGAFNSVNGNFLKRVGWSKGIVLKQYNNLSFDIEAPEGHLPVLWNEWSQDGYAAPLDRLPLFLRMEDCSEKN